MSRTIEVVLQAGANRGGLTLQRALSRRTDVRVGTIRVIDPKPGRADAIADLYARDGAVAVPVQARCEEAIAGLESEAPILLAVDDPAVMAKVLATRLRQVLLAQGVSRGPTGQNEAAPVFGISVAAVPGREDERARVARLFGLLARLSPAASSAVIRENPLAALRLAEVRQATSEVSASRLAVLDRLRDEPDLATLLWSGERYPMVVAERASGGSRQAAEQALNLGRPTTTTAIVLVSDAPKVEFFVVEPRQRRDGGYLRLHVVFERVLPAPVVRRTVIDLAPTRRSPPYTQPAAFTD